MPSSSISNASKVEDFLEYLKRVESTTDSSKKYLSNKNSPIIHNESDEDEHSLHISKNSIYEDETGADTYEHMDLDSRKKLNDSFNSDIQNGIDSGSDYYEKISSISEVINRNEQKNSVPLSSRISNYSKPESNIRNNKFSTVSASTSISRPTTFRAAEKKFDKSEKQKKDLKEGLTKTTDSIISGMSFTRNSTILNTSGGQSNPNTFYEGLKQKMNKLKQTIEEKNGHIKDIEDILNEERSKNSKLIEQIKNQEKRLKKQMKKEFEETMDSKLKMVKKLLEEKEKLAEKCKELSQVCKNLKDKIEEDAKLAADELEKALKKQKQQISAQEKIKRQTWMDQTRAEIKEATTQALQPQISKLLLQHKQSLASLQDTYEQKLRDQRNNLLAEREILKKDLQEKYDMTLEETLAKEREKIESIQSAHNKSLKEENEQLNLRFQQQLEQVREQSRQLLQQERIMNSENLERMKQEQERTKKSHEEEITRLRQLLEDKYETETTTMKERWQLEKEKWKQQVRSETEEEFNQKKKEYALKMKQQLDEQVNHIVSKMQEEVRSVNENSHKQIEEQTTKIREQFKHEVSELKSEASLWKERHNELRQRNEQIKAERDAQEQTIMDLETQISEYTSNLQRLQLEFNKESKKHKLALEKETQDLSEEIQRISETNEKLQQQVSTLENDIDILKELHLRELKNTISSKEAEIDRIMTATKQAIAAKDKQILSLQQDLENAEQQLQENQLQFEQQAQELLNDY